MLRAIRAELGPSFANDQQREFFDSQAPEIIYSGAMGAGKSRIICEKAWALAVRWPGATFGIFRKVAASLPATTMRTFWRDVADPARIARQNRSENWVELDNGARIYFLGLDPDPITGVPSKVGSLDLACAYVDEAVELGEQDWIMLLGRLRDPRMPWHQIGAATNPGSPKHWLKRRFTPATPERVYLHATAADNRFLPADYQRLIAAFPDNVYGQRLGRGLWVMAEGAIYHFPDEQVRRPDPDTRWRRVIAGIDWGFVHAFACEIVAQSGSGRLAVIGEVYETGRLIDDIIPILKRAQQVAHIEMFYADPSEPEYIATCQRAGLPMVAATNDVGPGIAAVSTAMKSGMTIDPACDGLLSEIPNYRWAQDRGTGSFREQPVKEGDDACDALRYAVMALTEGGTLLFV